MLCIETFYPFLCLSWLRFFFFFFTFYQTHICQSVWLIIYVTLIFHVNWMSNLIKEQRKERSKLFPQTPNQIMQKGTSIQTDTEQRTLRKRKTLNWKTQIQLADIAAARRENQTSVSFRVTCGQGNCALKAHSSLVFTQPPGRQQQGCYRCLSLNCDPRCERSRWPPANCSAARSSSERSSGRAKKTTIGSLAGGAEFYLDCPVPRFSYWIDGQQVGQKGHDGGGGGRVILQVQPLSGNAHTGADDRWW